MRFPFASPSLIHNPSSSPTPKRGKSPWMEEKTHGGVRKIPNTPSNLQEALQAPKHVSLSSKWGIQQTLARNKIKNPFFDMWTTSPLSFVLAAFSARIYELNGAQHTFRHSALWFSTQFSTAQPWTVWQHYVFEVLDVIPVAPDAGICFKINLFLSNHAPLSSCLFSSTTKFSY